ncbi:MAG: anthranilate synthase component I family protein [Crocinitomicaceae bacterium]|nr:anthranilate synthase component I family protein [Crocinitomicaceae bacterium]
MQQPDPFQNENSWQYLLSRIAGENCILLTGENSDFILGWSYKDEIKVKENKFDFDLLDSFLEKYKGEFIFGCLTYDLKNTIEPTLKSSNNDLIQFPLIHFFVPEHLVEFKNNVWEFYGDETKNAFEKLTALPELQQGKVTNPVLLTEKTTKEEYIQHVNKIKSEIQYGNIYELNYCVNFEAEQTELNSSAVFQKLQSLTNAPFSVYLNTEEHAVLCASPERFIKKENNKIISQPIKGTARRSQNKEEDIQIKEELRINPKERSENIMITDLVRNDLSKIAVKNSVQTEELCGVYTFKTVHQLISTISCETDPKINFSSVIKALFPMGSMTGAPKIAAMKIAEETEKFKRGLYSGSIGYIRPNGDFDFNVVIRSILHNKKSKTISCSVGSAITINSDPEKEYEECLLKLNALKRALE